MTQSPPTSGDVHRLWRELPQLVDDVLRARLSWSPLRQSASLWRLALVVLCFGLLYGGVMGCFAGRPLQMFYSAVKVPLLLSATCLLSLPSFFVLNTIAGLRSDFGQALRAIFATQAGLTIILAAFAPMTLMWYASFNDYESAVAFNTVIFGVASVLAQVLLRRHYQPLIARRSRHRVMVRVWIVLYAFTGIQMGWLLRPFIGFPGDQTQFFRPESWGNAYVIVGEMFWNLLFR